ncbi:MAG TPA: helix-turn-helix transcriptional regulator [Steroidobacter sp.]|uniref:helix-turn-helix domain-containing protein n=1 Tax=Steroidobacter sp. TaxID=1978227 RepID=UPI002ED7E4A5
MRQHRHLTPAQLAANSGVPLSRILRMESGMSEPTLSELFLLGQALRVKPSSFVEGVELVMHGALHGVRARNGDGRSEPPATAPES